MSDCTRVCVLVISTQKLSSLQLGMNWVQPTQKAAVSTTTQGNRKRSGDVSQPAVSTGAADSVRTQSEPSMGCPLPFSNFSLSTIGLTTIGFTRLVVSIRMNHMFIRISMSALGVLFDSIDVCTMLDE